MIRRFLAQVIMFRSYQIYGMCCLESSAPENVTGEKIFFLTSKSVDSFSKLTSQLIDLNRENSNYIDDIRRDLMVGVIVEFCGKLVHYGFLYKHNRTSCLLGLPHGCALIGNSFTVPAYRGRGCQGRSVLARGLAAREAGFSAIFAETSIENVNSGKGLVKAGMQHLGRMDLIVIARVFVIRWRRPTGFSVLEFCT